ncbi:ferredoxin oxidoreductase [Patescibacteria group bacterium]|nr:ferredoxin oxidoreductase [Patescibacteria group bacterium]
MKQFMMGSQIIALAAVEAGATGFFAYPITPASEIMSFWLKEKEANPALDFMQTEDEISAGFTTIGNILGGKVAFTATAGPGNVLMQDPLSMAESMRVPIVCIIGQRGGPSTGTVVYSQQEVTLTAYGGNSEGYRIVYSPAGLQELYKYTKKAFVTAWKYRFPTFVLTDGYTTKLRGEVNISKEKNPKIETIELFGSEKEYVNYRNCFEYEEEIYELNKNLENEFNKANSKVEEYFIYPTKPEKKLDCLIIAHGIVGLAAKAAIDQNKSNKKIALFRPITLRPFPKKKLIEMAANAKKIIVVESAANQLLRLVKENLYGLKTPITHIGKAGLGIYPDEIKKAFK